MSKCVTVTVTHTQATYRYVFVWAILVVLCNKQCVYANEVFLSVLVQARGQQRHVSRPDIPSWDMTSRPAHAGRLVWTRIGTHWRLRYSVGLRYLSTWNRKNGYRQLLNSRVSQVNSKDELRAFVKSEGQKLGENGMSRTELFFIEIQQTMIGDKNNNLSFVLPISTKICKFYFTFDTFKNLKCQKPQTFKVLFYDVDKEKILKAVFQQPARQNMLSSWHKTNYRMQVAAEKRPWVL